MTTTAKLGRDDDVAGGNDDDGNVDVMHDEEHADEFSLPIDADDDRWLKAREDVQNNDMTIALTSNGDNHFPQEQQARRSCGAKEVHICKTKEANGFNTWTKENNCLA